MKISGTIHRSFAILNCFCLSLFSEKISSSNHSFRLKEYLCHNHLSFLWHLFCCKGQLRTSPYVLQKIVFRKKFPIEV